MLLFLTVFLAFVNADCSNKASWGCDKIEDTDTDCVGAAARFCGVCKPECQDGGEPEPEPTKKPCPPPKEPTCKVCTSDMDCDGKLFSITTYGEGSNGRFGCTYPETYEFVNESEQCPVGTLLVKSDAECKSGDEWVGAKGSVESCAAAVAEQGGRFFIYGKSYKSYGCYMEKMETKECAAGWEEDKFDVYENIVCKDDEEKVKAEMFDDAATCANTIETYNTYDIDLCAPESDFRRKCCATCSETAVGSGMPPACPATGTLADTGFTVGVKTEWSIIMSTCLNIGKKVDWNVMFNVKGNKIFMCCGDDLSETAVGETAVGGMPPACPATGTLADTGFTVGVKTEWSIIMSTCKNIGKKVDWNVMFNVKEGNKIFMCCGDDLSAMTDRVESSSPSPVVNGFAALGLVVLLYGAFKHYAK